MVATPGTFQHAVQQCGEWIASASEDELETLHGALADLRTQPLTENAMWRLADEFEQMVGTELAIPLIALLDPDGDYDDAVELEPGGWSRVRTIRHRHGTVLERIIRVPNAGPRDWHRLDIDYYVHILGDSRSPRIKVAIELLDGSLVEIECPPWSFVRLVARMLSHLTVMPAGFPESIPGPVLAQLQEAIALTTDWAADISAKLEETGEPG